MSPKTWFRASRRGSSQEFTVLMMRPSLVVVVVVVLVVVSNNSSSSSSSSRSSNNDSSSRIGWPQKLMSPRFPFASISVQFVPRCVVTARGTHREKNKFEHP